MKIFAEISTWLKAYGLVIAALRNDIIYISRDKAIGDVLWVEPVIRSLAKTGRKYIFITAYPQLYDNFPFKNVLFKNRIEKKYKRAVRLLKTYGIKKNLINFDEAYEKDTQKHFLHAYQQTAGLPVNNEYPRLYLTGEESTRYKNPEPYIVIHLESFSVWNYRNVYGINWQKVINYLHDMGYKVFILAKEKSEYMNTIHLPLDLRGIIALIKNASLFIGIDSGPSHIAASLQIPAIIFFGAVDPWFRHFREAFNGAIMQQGCEYAGCYHREKENISGKPCLLFGDKGIPKCSIHSDEALIGHIDNFLRSPSFA